MKEYLSGQQVTPWPFRRRVDSTLVGACLVVGVLLVGCRELARQSAAEPKSNNISVPTPNEEPTPIPSVPLPPAVRIPDKLVDTDRWLLVRRVRDGEPGAWATGSFDAAKNKVIIETKGVREFAIDTSKIDIDWERLVILRLDGINSELRKRDYALLYLVRDGYGKWVVREPGKRIEE